MKRITLRRWQQEALHRFETSAAANFLAVATPGAGKTTFALSACVRALRARRAGRAVVVAPTQHLKHQWALAAEAFGLALEPNWASSDGTLPSDLHGVVVTYQQVAANPRALRALARGAFAILDEVHHAAESRAWGDGIRLALEAAAARLSLSGTPFRTDQNAIPFVRYRGDDAEPDYEYGYAEALADGRVVRPVYFPRIGGQMEWTGADGETYAHDFQDPIGAALASQRLRTALSPKHEWLPAVLEQAHAQLEHLRASDSSAGAMAIAMDQDHARSIARLLRERVGVTAAVATSDDPRASEKIASFARSMQPWIVAVRMVSEGVDIPRLRVGVYATHTLTDLFFRQAVGRLVRFTPGPARQHAYMFIPDDPRLRAFAEGIKRERRHSLRRRDDEDTEFFKDDDAPAESTNEEADRQLSLFSVISAVPTDPRGRPLERGPLRIEEPDDEAIDAPAAREPESAADAHIELPRLDPTFQPAPVPAEPASDAPGEVPTLSLPPIAVETLPATEAPEETPRRRRSELRALNQQRAHDLARRSGLSHAEINAELNRRTGIRRVSEATAAQLERRLEVANVWLQRVTGSH
jgi:superfamily II DNA or RNA helicase